MGMTGCYATNTERQAQAARVRSERIETKRAELAARLAAMGGK